MRCTIGHCQATLQYKGGENLEDYGCSNRQDGRAAYQYSGNVKVRDGWWFAAGYAMPFEYVDVRNRRADRHYTWYALVGSPESGQTELQGLGVGVQETLFSIPYVALPANSEFNREFDLLRDRMMNAWFDAHPVRTEVMRMTQESVNRAFGDLNEWGLRLGPMALDAGAEVALPPGRSRFALRPFANPLQKETRGKLRKLDADEIQQVEALIEKLHLQRVEREEDQRRREAHADKWL